MMVRTLRLFSGGLVAAIAALGAAGIAADKASAIDCAYSTPQYVSVGDAIDGQGGFAPEITSVGISLNGTCQASFRAGLLAPLLYGDALFFFVNTDGNPATGDPVIDGADAVISSLGDNISNPPPLLARWNGATFDFASGTFLNKLDERGAADAMVGQLGITTPTQITVRVGTIYTDPFDVSFIDSAPDKALAPLPMPVAFSPPAPPPPPPPPSVPVSPAAVPVVANRPATTGACTSAQARVRTLTRQITQAKRQRAKARTVSARRAATKRIARLTKARNAAQRAARGSCPAERIAATGHAAHLAEDLMNELRRRMG